MSAIYQIGQQLKTMRERRGIKVDSMVDRLCGMGFQISAPGYRRYERNEVSPKVEIAVAICQILETGLEELINGEAEVEGDSQVVEVSVQPGETAHLIVKAQAADGESFQPPVRVYNTKPKQIAQAIQASTAKKRAASAK